MSESIPRNLYCTKRVPILSNAMEMTKPPRPDMADVMNMADDQKKMVEIRANTKFTRFSGNALGALSKTPPAPFTTA